MDSHTPNPAPEYDIERMDRIYETLVSLAHYDGVNGEQYRDYQKRNRFVLTLLAMAAARGWPHGIRLDPAQPDWPVVYVEIPGVGQVSWHLPQYPGEWDRHTTEEKYARIARGLAVHNEHIKRHNAEAARQIQATLNAALGIRRPSPVDIELCECARWRDGITVCPVHGVRKSDQLHDSTEEL